MVDPRACRAGADAPVGVRKYGTLHATSMGVAAPRYHDANQRVTEVTRGMASSTRIGQVRDWGVEGGYQWKGVTRSHREVATGQDSLPHGASFALGPPATASPQHGATTNHDGSQDHEGHG